MSHRDLLMGWNSFLQQLSRLVVQGSSQGFLLYRTDLGQWESPSSKDMPPAGAAHA